MIAIRTLLGGLGWKVGALFATTLLVATGIWLGVVQWENRRLSNFNAALDAKINDPVTGYVVVLTQARTNNVTLEGAIKDQKQKFIDRAAEDARALAATKAALSRAQVATRKAERTSAGLLARKPQGTTLEARVLDVDSRIMETFK